MAHAEHPQSETKRTESPKEQQANILSAVTHEVRTPLYAILEAGNFLLREDPRPDQLALVNAIRTAGNNLLVFLNDVLDVNKLEEGKLTLEPRPFRLVELVNEIATIYAPQCRKKELYLNTDVPTDQLPVVIGDRVKLLQVLTNLVGNAIKFCPAGGVSIAVEHQAARPGGPHTFTVSVHDTGIGIAKDQLERIFEPFIQARQKTRYQFGGTGLGLAISRRILQAMGSELDVDSTPGTGTVMSFTLRLPAAPDDALTELRASYVPTSITLAPLNHLRVANVDDNPANLLINARYFDEWKLNYDQYSSGADFLATLKTERYDILLTDLRMPDISGYELARRIRRYDDPAVRGMVIIALTASASLKLNPRMSDAGVDALVGKPFDPVYLHQLIQQLGESRSSQRLTGAAAQPDEEFRFDEVREIFGQDDSDDFRQFLRLVVTDLASIQEELNAFKKDQSEARFRAIRHNTLTTTRLFQLTRLNGLLDRGLKDLLNGDVDKANASLPAIQKRITWFEGVLSKKLAE